MIRILLEDILWKKRITQAELARRTGIRPNTINDLYHELTPRINLEQIDKICEILNCTLSEILVRESENTGFPEHPEK